MRKIKFKAWHYEHKVMIDWENVQEHSMGFLFGYGTVNILQYTGSKDKNGKEIYEGDIIQDSISTGKVVYSEKRGGYRTTYTDGMAKWFIDYLDEEFKMVEIIGNIYENADLLKGLHQID